MAASELALTTESTSTSRSSGLKQPRFVVILPNRKLQVESRVVVYPTDLDWEATKGVLRTPGSRLHTRDINQTLKTAGMEGGFSDQDLWRLVDLSLPKGNYSSPLQIAGPRENPYIWTDATVYSREQGRFDRLSEVAESMTLVPVTRNTGTATIKQEEQDTYAKYQDMLTAYVTGQLGPALAEEIATDVIGKAAIAYPEQTAAGLLSPALLYQMAHHKCVDVRRRRNKAQLYPIDTQLEKRPDQVAEREQNNTLLRQALLEAMKGLTGDQRTVITLRFLEDRSITDTAAAMNRREDAVRQLQVRALNNMRAVLDPDILLN